MNIGSNIYTGVNIPKLYSDSNLYYIRCCYTETNTGNLIFVIPLKI